VGTGDLGLDDHDAAILYAPKIDGRGASWPRFRRRRRSTHVGVFFPFLLSALSLHAQAFLKR
jgi:hypothetical protein